MNEKYKETGKDYLQSREVELVVLTPDVLREGRLFASQGKETFNSTKLIQAHSYSEGTSTRHTRYPNIFLFDYQGVECFLVGNGHHRVAEALLNGRQIPCERDDSLGKVDGSIVNNPRAAQIKFAIYGIEGIWPFDNFLKGFVQLLDGQQNI